MTEERKLTGYPSIDKPWLKYYSEEAINAPLPECSIYEYVHKCNLDNLSRVAIEYYGTKITYQQLFEKVDCITRALSVMGVKKGEIVTVCTINQPEAIYLILALNRIGAVANMVYGGGSEKELEKELLNSRTRFVFTLDLFQERFVQLSRKLGLERIVVSTLTESMPMTLKISSRFIKKLKPLSLADAPEIISWKSFCKFHERCDKNKVELVDDGNLPAVITYTGGTTGGSKGVVLSNKAVLAVACQYILGEKALQRNSTWAELLPLFIAYGVTCAMLIPMIVGMTMVIRIVLSESIAELCRKRKPNHIVYGPAPWEQFADENVDLDLSYLKTPISGGDALRPSIEKKVSRYLSAHNCKYPLLNGYGMTEVGAAVSVNFSHAHCEGSIGIPFVKNTIAVFDQESGKELAYGEVGEICIRTPSMMDEYLGAPEETTNVMQKHSDGSYWIHSGDAGYINEQGFCFISGRYKRYLNRFAQGIVKKIFSLDIEKVLLTEPEVTNVAVVPQSHPTEMSVPVVFIKAEIRPEEKASLSERLDTRIKDELGDFYLPKDYYFVDEFPKTKIGKVDYLTLEKIAEKENLR